LSVVDIVLAFQCGTAVPESTPSGWHCLIMYVTIGA
jgi:hypothetical protein